MHLPCGSDQPACVTMAFFRCCHPWPLILPCCCINNRQRTPLLVSLLDGSVAAVDEMSGRKLWMYDTGTPLVSNKASLTVLPE